MEALIIKCVTKSIPVNNDLLYLSKRSYDGEIERVKALLNDAGTNEIGSSSRILQLNTAVLGTLSIDEKKRYLSSYQHENYMFQLQHYRCRKCQCVTMYKINAVTDPNTSYYCSYCDKKPNEFFVQQGCNRLLPVWYDDFGLCHYELPDELVGLRLGEKLLIQRYSCFVPIVHIKNGIMGIKGHCCCFKQDICDMANTLPRLKVNAIKVVKGIKNSDGFFF